MTLDHGRGKAPLLTIFGGDVTTSRLRAERAVSKLTPFYPMSPRWTAKAPLPGGDFAWGRFDDEVDEARERWRFLGEDQARRLVAAYGSNVEGDPRRRQRAQRSRPGLWAGTDGRRSALSHEQGMGAFSRRHPVAALQARPDHAAFGSRGAGGIHGGGKRDGAMLFISTSHRCEVCGSISDRIHNIVAVRRQPVERMPIRR